MIRKQPLKKQVSIGVIPPMQELGTDSTQEIRSHLSWSWIAGIFTVGIIGTVMLGMALHVSLGLNPKQDLSDEEAKTIQLVDERIQDLRSERVLSQNRGNRLVIHIPQQAIRQKVELVSRRSVDGKEVPFSQPFTYIKSGLSLSYSDAFQKIPSFDGAKIIQSGIQISTDVQEEQLAPDNQQKNYVFYDLPLANLQYGGDAFEEATLQSIAQAALIDGEGNTKDDSSFVSYIEEPLSATGQSSLQEDDAITLTPINLVDLPQNGDQNNRSEQMLSETTATIGEDGTLFPILRSLGISEADAEQIIPVMDRAVPLLSVQAGWKLRVGFLQEKQTGLVLAHALAIYQGDARLGSIQVQNDRTYRVVDDNAEIFPEIEAVRLASVSNKSMTLYDAIYQTALDRKIPLDLVPVLVSIFIYDFDFKQQVSTSDRLNVIYSNPAAGQDEESFKPEIVHASLTRRGTTRSYYLLKDPQSSTYGYFDEQGRSAQKFLMRKPIKRGTFRSGYGLRRHPILKRLRMHNGVDWSAPRGTPIFSAGDGVIKHAKWIRGYGNQVKVKHANGYQTSYSHMTKFRKGLRAGDRVNLGQVIGYVGSTGLSTGPHLHYEVFINGKNVDPAKLKVPRGKTLKGSPLSRFQALVKKLSEAANSGS